MCSLFILAYILYCMLWPYNNKSATELQLNVSNGKIPSSTILKYLRNTIYVILFCFWRVYAVYVVLSFGTFCWMDAINLSILHSREREVTKFLQRAVFSCYCPSSSLSQWLPVELPHWSLHIITELTLKPLYQKPSLITLRSNVTSERNWKLLQ